MGFAEKIMQWQRSHGRRGLPWQGTRDPYRIWLSEIMLQQTQVGAVVSYYERFLARFPDPHALAAAHQDEVLRLWSGLGYYARARNLHAAAKVISAHGFPPDAASIERLPGVGRSTAAAIAAFAYGERGAILDGNVKRVLARHHGIEGEERQWSLAARLLPAAGIESYTQGLMDLGAMVCMRRPRCDACPVRRHCAAHRAGRTHEIPAPRPRAALPHRETTMLVLEHRGAVLLEKRAPVGIWGGLWCLPEIDRGADAANYCREKFGARVTALESMPTVDHGFTHFSLTITPARASVVRLEARAGETTHAWLKLDEAKAAGIPSPVRRILEMIER